MASSSKSSSSSSRYAWCTLVMRSEAYVCGALVLGSSLEQHGSQFDRVCMVTDDIAAEVVELLHEHWDYVVRVPAIQATAGVFQRKQVRFGERYNAWLPLCLTKFTALCFTQYEKVAILDADMLCVGPPDALFQCDTPAGICDALKNDHEGNRFFHGKPLPKHLVQSSLTRNFYAMRGCLLLFSPNQTDWENIRNHAEKFAVGDPSAMAGPDEYFITKYFLKMQKNWIHLHSRYGMVSWAAEADSPETGSVPAPVFLHYVSEKPWDGPDKVTGNWPDFAKWDAVAATVLENISSQSMKRRLFEKWMQRKALPISLPPAAAFSSSSTASPAPANASSAFASPVPKPSRNSFPAMV